MVVDRRVEANRIRYVWHRFRIHSPRMSAMMEATKTSVVVAVAAVVSGRLRNPRLAVQREKSFVYAALIYNQRQDRELQDRDN